MLLRTDGGLRAVGMVGPQHLTDGVEQLTLVTGQSDVILFIHSLQLCMEATDNHILETVGLNLRPVLHFVGRDVLRVAGHIVRGIGIRTLRTDGSHQFVILVGNEVLGSLLRQRVYLSVNLLTCLRISQFAIGLVALFDLIKQRSLSLGVVGTKLTGALKHQVLQIVRQTRRLCGVVFRTRPYGDICLNTRLLLVHTQIHLQSILQGIDTRLSHISLYSLILVLAARTHAENQQSTDSQ